MKNENIQALLRGVRLQHVAKASGIPLATLWRWRKKNQVPGHPPVKALHVQRIREGVRKCKAADLADLDQRVALGKAMIANDTDRYRYPTRSK